jgi:hypothetical protein
VEPLHLCGCSQGQSFTWLALSLLKRTQEQVEKKTAKIKRKIDKWKNKRKTTSGIFLCDELSIKKIDLDLMTSSKCAPPPFKMTSQATPMTLQALRCAMERDFEKLGREGKSPYMPWRMDTIQGLKKGVVQLRKMRELRGILDIWLDAGGIPRDVEEGICVLARFMLCAMLHMGSLAIPKILWQAAYMNRRYQKMAENLAVFYVRTHPTKVSSVFGQSIRRLIFTRDYLRDLSVEDMVSEMPLRFRRDLILALRLLTNAEDEKIQAALAFSSNLPLILFRIRTCRWGDRSVSAWIAYYLGKDEEEVKAHLEILGY